MSANDRTTESSEAQVLSYEPTIVRHGPIMDGRQLMHLFLFRTERSFRRAAQAGRLPVPVFRLEGRRGWFARTSDVERWLAQTSPPAP